MKFDVDELLEVVNECREDGLFHTADYMQRAAAYIVELEGQIAAIRKAIDNPGPRPDFHYRIKGRHRQEWPLLWRLLDELG